MKAGADFQQTRNPATEMNLSAGRLGNSAKDFEQSRFPRAVSSDDSDNFAGVHLNVYVTQRPEFSCARPVICGFVFIPIRTQPVQGRSNFLFDNMAKPIALRRPQA